MINKTVKISIIFIVFLVVMIMIGRIVIRTNTGCEPPLKPANVPISAIWKGGCDGGNWVELVNFKEDTVRFRIYRDWNGELLLDANFIYENCNSLQLTKLNWSEYIAYFNNTLEIYSKFQLKDNYCRLIPVYPAYYEEKIE